MRLSAIKTILMGLFSAILFFSCQKESIKPQTEVSPNQPQNPPVSPPPVLPRTPVQESKLVSSTNYFAFRLFAALRNEQQAQNLFLSPLSISSALTMAYNGAGSTTKEAMRQTLGFGQQTDEEINQSFHDLNKLLFALDEKVIFTSANAIWYDQNLKLQAPFVQQNQKAFGATVQGLDFRSGAAINTMNDWVKEKTQGKINDIVHEIRGEDIMFLVNAIYFKATWTYPFDKSMTREGSFLNENGSTSRVDFMTMYNGKYLHYNDGEKSIIDLPYGNQQFSMTLVVPNGVNTVSNMMQELTSSKLTSWLALADTTDMYLRLPKFKMEYTQEFKQILTQLGMGEAFARQADFSRMVTDVSGGISISKVMHKTFVAVNEEGTEAAAVTAVGTIADSAPPTILVNRPFVFLIREKSTNAILFIGQLMNP